MVDSKNILNKYQENILENIKIDYAEISNIKPIRVNLSAVFTCEYKSEKYILKYLVMKIPEVEEYEDIDSLNEYTMLHATKMIDLAKVAVFPLIYDTKYYEIDDYLFLVIIEEYLPYKFSEGILKKYEENNNNIIDTATNFLIELLSIYKTANLEANFVSHRDLSFDNLMFDTKYNLKMIDLGSAKSRTIKTTNFAIPAPTKYFYASPEYNQIHKIGRTNEDLMKAEIYTIGLLTLSLLNALNKNLFTNDNKNDCGIIYWILTQKKEQAFDKQLKEALKDEYLNYILIEIFSGDNKNTLFRLLKAMTESSVSARIKSYDLVIKHLERMIK